MADEDAARVKQIDRAGQRDGEFIRHVVKYRRTSGIGIQRLEIRRFDAVAFRRCGKALPDDRHVDIGLETAAVAAAAERSV